MAQEINNLRLIEAGFPCHQVGAETQRERDTGKAPPTHRLHVWWARRPLTPSRAAILASLLPADYDPDQFLMDLGIERVQVNVNGVWWTITGAQLNRLETDEQGDEVYRVDNWTLKWLDQENEQRRKHLELISRYRRKSHDPRAIEVLDRWELESQPLPGPLPNKKDVLPVRRVPGDPAWAQVRMAWEDAEGIRLSDDKYGYPRAFTNSMPLERISDLTVLDPTAGGGSIPFEAVRLGHRVIANELNPVAAVILKATVDYPAQYGTSLLRDIDFWGSRLVSHVEREMADVSPFSPLPDEERQGLERHCQSCPELIPDFGVRESDHTGLIFCRQVTCSHCGGEAPLLNSCWLSKQSGDQWGVRVVPDGREKNGTLHFATYRAKGGRGPTGEDPDFATVNNGVGTCIHCKQAISSDEIKRQARGESRHGTWSDRLFAVAAVRYKPKLDKKGHPVRYKSGERKGEIRTEKITFFRPPNDRDLAALAEAERRLQEKWPEWERQGLIPTENIPDGHKTREPLRVGITRWCDMFTPRQLLGHLTLIEELNRLKPLILEELGQERGRAVVTYLQFAIDKGVDYNSRQTRWHYSRGILVGTFARHDFSLKWTFGEMIFTGPNSGASWGLSQVVDAYAGMAELMRPLHERLGGGAPPPAQVTHSTAAHLPAIEDGSVDLVCMDPPYYNNVQYAELSDYFYVWQKRTLGDLYPSVFDRRLTNKSDEAVANPARDGGSTQAAAAYERMMGEIFAECRRVLKDDGLLTLMFTHKSQEAWEALTRSLIDSGWTITACFPVESEGSFSIHQMDMAAAASSVFLSCRKREIHEAAMSVWTGFGGTGVQQQVQEAVKEALVEFEPLQLTPVDEMVAAYGRALRVLSQSWPVMDGDDLVSPMRAMNEASRVVAEHQVRRITGGRLQVEDLNPEAAMALTLFGIYGLAELPYDDALNLSRSLGIRLENQNGGYRVQGEMIGINPDSRTSRDREPDQNGYYAPLLRSGSKLRLARPEERHPKRLEHPQTEWDLLHGLITAYRQGDIPVARAFLQSHASGRQPQVLDLLKVWTLEIADEGLRQEGRTIEFGMTEA